MTQYERTIKYFKQSAEKNLKTAEYLFKGRRYDACLFFCHLALEKLLKGILVERTRKPAPYLHSLNRLAEFAGIVLTGKQYIELEEISDFNIAGRYDDKKLEFYKKCTKPYTQKYLSITKEIFSWLTANYQKKS